MQAAGTLELFAGLSVALAGFVGISLVLRGSPANAAERSNQRALRTLVEYCVCTLVFAVTPLVLWNLGYAEASVWRIAAVVFSFVSGAYYYVRFDEMLIHAVGMDTIRSFRFAVALDAVLIVALVASAFRAIEVDAKTLFLLGLLWNVIAMALSYVRLIHPTAPGEGDTSR